MMINGLVVQIPPYMFEVASITLNCSQWGQVAPCMAAAAQCVSKWLNESTHIYSIVFSG